MIRNISRRSGMLFLFAALCACGGADNGELFDGDAGLGELEQDFSAPKTTTFQYGTNTVGHQGCRDTVGVVQHCSIPNTTTRTLELVGGDASWDFWEQVVFSTATFQVDNATNWTFTYPAASAPIAPGATRATFTRGVNVPDKGAGRIENYYLVSFSGLSNLNEGPGVQGTYQTHARCNVNLDTADLDSDWGPAFPPAGPGQPLQNMRAHAIGAATLECMGLGLRSNDVPAAGNTFAARQFNASVNGRLPMTNGMACLASGFSGPHGNIFSNNGVECPTGD